MLSDGHAFGIFGASLDDFDREAEVMLLVDVGF